MLNFAGVNINPDGFITLGDNKTTITYEGNNLYVPENGYDLFKMKKLKNLSIFDPTRYMGHTLLVSDMVVATLSNILVEDDDVIEIDSDGNPIPIVSLMVRKANDTDNVTRGFNGIVVEVILRPGEDNDVLSKIVDPDNNQRLSIIEALILAIDSVQPGFIKNKNRSPLWRGWRNAVDKAHKLMDREYDEAQLSHQMDVRDVRMGEEERKDIDLVDNEYEDYEEDNGFQEEEFFDYEYEYNEIYDDLDLTF